MSLNEEPWMCVEYDVRLEAGDVDLLEVLADSTAYPDQLAWVTPMMESLGEDAQCAHRLPGLFDRLFKAVQKAQDRAVEKGLFDE